MNLIQSKTGERKERYSLRVNPTFETAIKTPLTDVKLPRLKAWEEFNSPAIQALRLYSSQIENHEELDARRRELDMLMRQVARDYEVPWAAVNAAVHHAAAAGDLDEDEEEVDSLLASFGDGDGDDDVDDDDDDYDCGDDAD